MRDLKAVEPAMVRVFCLYLKHMLKYCETRQEFNIRHGNFKSWLHSLQPTSLLPRAALQQKKKEMREIVTLIRRFPELCLFQKMADGHVTFSWHTSSMNER